MATTINVNDTNWDEDVYHPAGSICLSFCEEYINEPRTKERDAAARRLHAYLCRWLRILAAKVCSASDLNLDTIEDLADAAECLGMLQDVLGSTNVKAPSPYEWVTVIKKAKHQWWATPRWPTERRKR